MSAPSPVRLGRFEVESPEWLELRRRGIGGSDVAAVMGLSPWLSAFTLWHIKAGTVEAPKLDSEPVYWGKVLESLVATRWRQEHPDKHAGHWQGCTWADPAEPWRHANPDWIATDGHGHREIVEIKTTRFGDEWGHSGGDIVPPYYLTQLLWYCDIMSAGVGWLAVLIGGSDYREYRFEVSEHADEIATIRAMTRAFWESLQAGDAPDIDASNSTYQVLREMHPDIDGSSIEIEPAMATDAVTAITMAASAERALRLSKSLLLDVMGPAKTATVAGKTIAVRQATKRGDAWGKPFIKFDKHAADHLAAAHTEGQQ